MILSYKALYQNIFTDCIRQESKLSEILVHKYFLFERYYRNRYIVNLL